MSWLGYLVLFILGNLVGSYLYVLAWRFSEKKGFRDSLRGRSRCPHCKKVLRWYELIPLLSFSAQRGRCRSCGHRLSREYPIVELLSGLVFVLVPWYLGWSWLTALWLLAFLIFILIASIDLRLGIIPDTLILLLILLAIVGTATTYFRDTEFLLSPRNGGSFLGSYGLVFSLDNNDFLLNRLGGAIFGLLFLGSIYLLTRGRAIGFGDVKLAGALGLLLGWPDVILALVLAFLLGALFALPLLLAKKRNIKDALPFGPFMVLGIVLVFFFGYQIIDGYFRLFELS